MHFKKLVYSVLITVGILFICVKEAKCQRNFDFAVGLGLQEMVHLGARYQFDQFKAGLSIGSFPANGETNLAFSADIYYHFAGKSKFTSIKPWFFRSSYLFEKTEDDLSEIRQSWIALRLGRDFNISKKIGIAFDGGLSKRISYKEEFKRPYSPWNLFDFSIWPSTSIQVYYRLK